jgi:hypothetical protein
MAAVQWATAIPRRVSTAGRVFVQVIAFGCCRWFLVFVVAVVAAVVCVTGGS